jgi:hypothetical protein
MAGTTILGMSSLESRLMRIAERQYEQACKQLVPIARINSAAVASALEAFDHSDPEEAVFAAQAIGYAFAQLVHLHRANLCLAMDYEMLSAEAVREHS